MRIKCFTCGRGAWVDEDFFALHDDLLFCPYCDEPLKEAFNSVSQSLDKE